MDGLLKQWLASARDGGEWADRLLLHGSRPGVAQFRKRGGR